MGDTTPSRRKGKPPFQWWSGQAGGLGLKKTTSGLAGPCPLCGGTDRFFITRKSGEALIGCRQCGDGKTFLPDVLKAVGWVDDGPGPQRMKDQKSKQDHGPPVPPVSVYDDDMAGPADPPGPAPEQKETGRWTYRNLAGQTVTVRRMEPGRNGRKKDFPRTPTGLPGPWLPLAGYDDNGPLLIVEGETCCDRARKLGYNCTTWQGGTGAAGKTHWAAITNAEVVIWPDNDAPGHKAAAAIAEELHGQGRTVKMCHAGTLPPGHDIADVEEPEARRIIGAASPWTPSTPAGSVPPWDHLGYSWDDVEAAEFPPVIIEGRMNQDLAIMPGEGATGKTTLAIDLAICVALNRPWLGHNIARPGRVLYVTGEDDRSTLLVTVRRIAEERGLTNADKAKLAENLRIWDASGTQTHLVEGSDPLKLTGLPGQICGTFRGDELTLIVFDPLASFGGPESGVNDSMQSFVTACRQIIRDTGAGVLVLHHVSKESAKHGDNREQGMARGGSALESGARHTINFKHLGTMAALQGETIPEALDASPQAAIAVLDQPKHRYDEKPPRLYLAREPDSFVFSWATEEPPLTPEERSRMDKEQLLRFIRSGEAEGRRYTMSALRDSYREELGMMTKRAVEKACGQLLTEGRLIKVGAQGKGGAQHYLKVTDAKVA